MTLEPPPPHYWEAGDREVGGWVGGGLSSLLQPDANPHLITPSSSPLEDMPAACLLPQVASSQILSKGYFLHKQNHESFPLSGNLYRHAMFWRMYHLPSIWHLQLLCSQCSSLRYNIPIEIIQCIRNFLLQTNITGSQLLPPQSLLSVDDH